MSNRFLNDHSVRKVQISKILRITAGGLHCWCDSNVGIIKKQNVSVADFLWDSFRGIDQKESLINKPMIPIIRTENPNPKKWWQKLWDWIKSLFISQRPY